MFERNKIDSTVTQQQMTVPVEITFESGRPVRGKIIMPVSRSLPEVLNSAHTFIEFEPYGGERLFIAKSAVRGIKAITVPFAPMLESRSREIDNFDPYAVLAIARGTPFEGIRQAYLRLAKLYHPDRYEGIELPREVREYFCAMARRINVAFSALEGMHQSGKSAAKRHAPAHAAQPRA